MSELEQRLASVEGARLWVRDHSVGLLRTATLSDEVYCVRESLREVRRERVPISLWTRAQLALAECVLGRVYRNPEVRR